MALALTDLVTDLDPDEFLADLLQLAKDAGLPADDWEAGDAEYDLLDAIATLFCRVWNATVAPAIRAQFLEYATDAWLTFLAWARYNRPRQQATFATGSLVIENRGAFAGTISPGQIRARNASTGKTYTNATGGFMAPWAGGAAAYPTLTLTFTADQAGTGSNVLAGAIEAYPSAPLAAPAGVYARTNASPFLAADLETDEQLRRRCRLAESELGQGPRAEYESIALDPVGAFTRRKKPVPSTWGTAPVNISRVRILEPGNGVVRVILASRAGAAAGDSSTEDSDVFKAHIALQAFAVAPGATETTESAVEVPINLGTIQIYVPSEKNITKAEAEANATAAINEWFATLAIGGFRQVAGGVGKVYVDHVRAIAQLASGAELATCAASDVTLADNDVAVPVFSVVATIVKQGA